MESMDQFTGTKAVSERHAFDVGALQRHLERELPGFAGPLTVEQFKGGQSNPTYKLITPQRTYAMRSKPGPVAKLLPSAHAIEREFRVMSALARTDVPVARMFLLCDEMNRVIAALHSVDVTAVGLADFGKPGNYFQRQLARWSKQYIASQLQVIPEMDRLIDWLPAHLPASALDESQMSVVHGDYRLDNLIFDPHEPRIAAVLDWELSTLGHPLADFSYHCMSWHIPPGTFRGIGGLDHAALGIPGERDYVRRYCERTGRTDTDAVMADWNFYMAYNLFRLAAITQGIAKRVVEGTAASAQARATGDATLALAQMAWRFAQSA